MKFYLTRVSLGILISVLVTFLFLAGYLEQLELHTYDWRLTRSVESPGRRLPFVIVGITRDFQSKTGEAFSRKHYSRIINILVREGASVIGFDIFFPEIGNNPTDRELLETVRRSRRVVLPIFSTTRLRKKKNGFCEAGPLASSASSMNAASLSLGHINALPDVDQVVNCPFSLPPRRRSFPRFPWNWPDSTTGSPG